MTGDTEPENIRQRLLKVLRLAQEGVGGERENAEVLLQKLLRKHSLSLADLEGAHDQPVEMLWLAGSDADERTVLSQLAMRLFGSGRKHFTRSTDFSLGIELGSSERTALVIAWEVYRAAFAEARHALMMGFCFKHGLYASDAATTQDMSESARERAQRALRMAEVLPLVESPGRRLGKGE